MADTNPNHGNDGDAGAAEEGTSADDHGGGHVGLSQARHLVVSQRVPIPRARIPRKQRVASSWACSFLCVTPRCLSRESLLACECTDEPADNSTEECCASRTAIGLYTAMLIAIAFVAIVTVVATLVVLVDDNNLLLLYDMLLLMGLLFLLLSLLLLQNLFLLDLMLLDLMLVIVYNHLLVHAGEARAAKSDTHRTGHHHLFHNVHIHFSPSLSLFS